MKMQIYRAHLRGAGQTVRTLEFHCWNGSKPVRPIEAGPALAYPNQSSFYRLALWMDGLGI
jgi:hypothetical protein